jgi:deoxyribonuclease-4
MKRVGAHCSATGGVSFALEHAGEIGARSLALFVKNQRRWISKEISKDEIDRFNKKIKSMDISKDLIMPHASYLINLGSPKKEMRDKSIESIVLEMKLCKSLGINKLNVHPGSHLREISEEECLLNISKSIDIASTNVPDVKIVIENTAGQGSNVGYKLEHLSYIIKNTNATVGICIDTCHAFAAGYDISTYDGAERFFDSFNNEIGIEYLSGVHLNDSKFECGTKKDRHESLGKGYLGLEVFKYIMNTTYFDEIPLILETTNHTIWKNEIKMLYNMIK